MSRFFEEGNAVSIQFKSHNFDSKYLKGKSSNVEKYCLVGQLPQKREHLDKSNCVCCVIWPNQYPKAWANDTKFRIFASQLNDEKFESPGQIRHFWARAQQELCHSSGESRVLLKTHNAAGVYDVGEFPSKKYTEKAVYVVRDPKDVAISYSYHFGQNLDISINSLLNETNINFKLKDLSRGEFLSSWDNHVKSWQNLPFPVLRVRYEDLLENPFHYTEKILTFLDIEPTITIEEIVNLTSFKKLANQEKNEGFAEAGKNEMFFRNGSKSQWLQYDEKKFEKLIAKFEPIMRGLNYI